MDEDVTPVETISVTTEDLTEMIRTGNYDPAIVRSVTSKRKGQRIMWIFTLTDERKVTI